MPRFVILRHELPPTSDRPTHWDFMLEWGEVLRTWALDQEPAVDTTIAAKSLADHRLAYLDYEGPVSGNRGSVTRVEHGTYTILEESAGALTLRLTGTTLNGTVQIAPIGDSDQRVSFSFLGDSSATAVGA